MEVPDVLLNCFYIYISFHSLNLIHLLSTNVPLQVIDVQNLFILKFKRHTLSLELDLCEVWARAQGQGRGQVVAIPVHQQEIMSQYVNDTEKHFICHH